MSRFICFLIVFLVEVAIINQLQAADSGTTEKTPKKYQLSVCAVFKNEAPYLKEWIEYHQLIGVNHFYLYDCGSTDNFTRILRPYIRKGVVTLTRWPEFCKENADCLFKWALMTQIPAYENALLLHAVKETEWLTFLNVDEFLVPMHGNRITDVLDRYQEYSGVDLSMEWYEGFNVGRDPTRKLVIETVELTKDPREDVQKTVSKMIFKPEKCKGFTWPPYQCVFNENSESTSVSRSELRVNRYLHRFKGFLQFGKKAEKLRVDNRLLQESEIRQLLDFGYEIIDQERAIYRFVPQVRESMK